MLALGPGARFFECRPAGDPDANDVSPTMVRPPISRFAPFVVEGYPVYAPLPVRVGGAVGVIEVISATAGEARGYAGRVRHRPRFTRLPPAPVDSRFVPEAGRAKFCLCYQSKLGAVHHLCRPFQQGEIATLATHLGIGRA